SPVDQHGVAIRAAILIRHTQGTEARSPSSRPAVARVLVTGVTVPELGISTVGCDGVHLGTTPLLDSPLQNGEIALESRANSKPSSTQYDNYK
ncbi:MAG: hypothetical protein ACI9NC_003338, partial [Verrucomicrobiales bacterium]